MKILLLNDQLDWARACLEKMKGTKRPQGEVDLQEAICFTLEQRIEEKYPTTQTNGLQ